MGMVTAQGLGVAASWEGVLRGRDVLRPWDALRGGHGVGASHPLAQVRVAQCGTLPRPAELPERLWRRLSRTQQLACLAVDEALAQGGLPHKLQGMRVGIFLGTTVCGMDVNERFYAHYRRERPGEKRADPALMQRLPPEEVAELIARRHAGFVDPGLRQTCLTTCVGSAMAIGNAADALALGECDVAIAGGAEALCRVVLSGFHALRVVAKDGCRPFDKDRPGITVGEGSAVLILERARHAAARHAAVLAWLRGFGVTCDAYHLTAPEPEATQAARAMRAALERAGTGADEVDYVNAHGTGTRDNDAMETRAIRAVFGGANGRETLPPVSSTKRYTGHTFGAAGAVEAIFCVQALREGILPANAGSVTADPALELPVIRGAALRCAARVAMSTNFAFGGNNAALVFRQA